MKKKGIIAVVVVACVAIIVGVFALTRQDKKPEVIEQVIVSAFGANQRLIEARKGSFTEFDERDIAMREALSSELSESLSENAIHKLAGRWISSAYDVLLISDETLAVSEIEILKSEIEHRYDFSFLVTATNGSATVCGNASFEDTGKQIVSFYIDDDSVNRLNALAGGYLS